MPAENVPDGHTDKAMHLSFDRLPMALSLRRGRKIVVQIDLDATACHMIGIPRRTLTVC